MVRANSGRHAFPFARARANDGGWHHMGSPKSVFFVLSLAGLASILSGVAFAQSQPAEFSRPRLTPDQLDTLVAPIALYPDPLLSQALAASTYPLELVEAWQWLQRHSELRGPQRIEAARQFNWDPSVQAMVVFPDVLRMLTQNVMWTTDLGNAVLAQQADVMDAVQRLRAQAQQSGRLASTPEQAVTSQAAGPEQSAIAIQPANPQVLYVPAYNPAYVWGPPVAGSYPSLWYPPESSGYGFGPGVAISALGSLFSGLASWSGWGLNWLTHGLFLNGLFPALLGLGSGGYGGGLGGGSASGVMEWTHNPVHRLGVPYPTTTLARSFGGGRGLTTGSRGLPAGAAGSGPRAAIPYRGGFPSFTGRPANPYSEHSAGRSPSSSEGWRTFGPTSGGPGGRLNSQSPMSFRGGPSEYPRPSAGYRGLPAVGQSGIQRSSAPVAQRFSGARISGPSGPAVGSGHFSAPKSAGHFKPPKAPSFRAPSFKAPKFSSHSGGHSSGGHSGGHSKSGHHR